MGTFRSVRSVVLLLATGTLAAAAALLAWLWERRRRAARDAALARIANALTEALGDALLVVDPDGRIVDANDAAVALAGEPLVGRDLAALGPDLPVLARGLARGPAGARVCLSVGGWRIPARAALVRASRTPPRDVVIVRPDPPPLPPTLPAPRAQATAPPPLAPDAAGASAIVAALAAAVREPLSRAARAASLLRLSAPATAGRASGELAELESALADAERRVAALAAVAQAGPRRAVDVGALVEELGGALSCPPGVTLRIRAGEARAHVDDRALRAALREVLRCAAGALAGGGELTLATRGGDSAPQLELALGGGDPAPVVALARALLAPQGVRVDAEPRRPGGALLRAALPPPPPEAEAEAEVVEEAEPATDGEPGTAERAGGAPLAPA